MLKREAIMQKKHRSLFDLVTLIVMILQVSGCIGRVADLDVTLNMTVVIFENSVDLQEVELLVNDTIVAVSTSGQAGPVKVPKGEVSIKASLAGYQPYDQQHILSKQAT